MLLLRREKSMPSDFILEIVAMGKTVGGPLLKDEAS